MKDYVRKVHCNKCGAYLFTEQEINNKYKMTNHSKLNYKNVSNTFICDKCLVNERSNIYAATAS